MKKTIYYLTIVALFLLSQTFFAQIHVDENGSVGIGTDTPSALHKLKITSDGTSDYEDENEYLKVLYTGVSLGTNMTGISSEIITSPGTGYAAKLNGGRVGLESKAIESGIGYRYGLLSYAYYGADENRALHAVAYGNSNSNKSYGVHTRALGASDYNCALYAEASGASNNQNWAGVFNGRIMVNGTEQFSDEKLKENYETVDNALENIKKMKVKKYNFKKNNLLKFTEKKHYGFTAQDMEKVFPELVSEATIYPTVDPDLDEVEINTTQIKSTFKTINYTELIPILVQGLQDQQETIEILERNQEDMLKRIEQLEK